LTIGSDDKKNRQVGIRKKLNPFWSINSYLESPAGTDKKVLNTFLEWDYAF
jgi:hypothetical protein